MVHAIDATIGAGNAVNECSHLRPVSNARTPTGRARTYDVVVAVAAAVAVVVGVGDKGETG